MSFFKRLLRQPLVKQALGRLAAGYLRLLRATNRFTFEVGSGVAGPPSAADPWLDAQLPAIFGMWHGQHIQMSLMMRPTDRVATIISRNPDGDINTIALERLGVRVMRASGARGRRRSADTRSKGGAEGLRGMLKALKAGESVAFSADVPKITRRCDAGILTLARFAGRPIVPTAVVTSRHIRFGSWDKACLSLPFGKGAVVLGEPIFVPRECEGEAFERVRCHLETEMDRVHVRAYALVGRHDRAAYYDAPIAPVGALPEGVA